MICHLLYDHRVLTTSQIADFGLDSLRRAQRHDRLLGGARKCQNRLSRLYDLDAVNGCQPRRFSISGTRVAGFGAARA
jgi:hypothetical protein